MNLLRFNRRLTYASLTGLIFSAALAHRLAAQTASLSVKLLDAIDSDRDKDRQTYRAMVVQTGNVFGAEIPRDTPALLVLERGAGDYRWTLRLVGLATDGQVMRANGHTPAVVPNGAGLLGSLTKSVIATKTRIAAGIGVTLRFSIDEPLVATRKQAPAQPGVPGARQPAPAAATPARALEPLAPAAKLPGPAADKNTQIGDSSTVFQSNGFEIRLVGCSKQGTATSTCDFSITNQGRDRELSVNPDFGVVDSKGQVIHSQRTDFAGTRGKAMTVAGLPATLKFTYGGLDPEVASLIRIPLSIRDEQNARAQFEWRNVALQGSPAAQVAAVANTNAAVQEVNNWRFTVERCNQMPREDSEGAKFKVVECFIKAENLKADRELMSDGAVLVDQSGQQVGSCWYRSRMGCGLDNSTGWLGDEKDYTHNPTVPVDRYNQLQPKSVRSVGGFNVSFGKPQYFYASFSDVDLRASKAALLKWNFRGSNPNGGYGRMDVSWHGVPIAPVPSLSSKAKSEIAAATPPEPVFTGTPQEQANRAADAFWKRALTTCGDATYARSIRMTLEGFDPDHPAYDYDAYKGVTFVNKMIPVTPAEALNGVEWQAGTNMRFIAHRSKPNTPGAAWSGWGNMMLPLIVKIEKIHGKVTFNQGTYASILTGPACSEVQ